MRDKFASYHPVIQFVFFLGAIGCGMLLMHPGFLACSMILSFLYYLTVHGRDGAGYITGLLVLFVLLSVINPLFNTYGETVLFRYFNDRTYTKEALLYGMALAAMVVSVLLWFSSCNRVMTSDRLLYLFGRLSPSVTLIFIMVIRLIPSYKNKVLQMSRARKGIGKGMDTGSKIEKIRQSMALLSTLVSWALESGVITSESMQSRGYGCGKRTGFSLYRMEGRDKGMLVYMAALLGVVMFCCLNGAAAAVYTPGLQCSWAENSFVPGGLLAYFLFLLIPSAVNIGEEIRWYSLKSKI